MNDPNPCPRCGHPLMRAELCHWRCEACGALWGDVPAGECPFCGCLVLGVRDGAYLVACEVVGLGVGTVGLGQSLARLPHEATCVGLAWQRSQARKNGQPEASSPAGPSPRQ